MINRDVILFEKKKEVDDPVLQKPTISLFVGSTGSGKSTMMLNFLDELSRKNDYDTALFVTPNKKDVLLKYIGDEVKITDSMEDVNTFIRRIKDIPDKDALKFKHILVFDDCVGSKTLDIKNNASLVNFILSHRHHNTWCCFSLQTYKNSLNTTIRKMANLMFLWYPPNESERKAIIDEVPVQNERMKQAFEAIRDEYHTPLYLNLQNKTQPQLFKGFNQKLNI